MCFGSKNVRPTSPAQSEMARMGRRDFLLGGGSLVAPEMSDASEIFNIGD